MPNTTEVASSWAIVLPPVRLMGQEALGAIPAHARQEAGRTVDAEFLCQGSEEHIDRGSAGVSFWILGEPERTLAEHEMAIGRSHQHSLLS